MASAVIEFRDPVTAPRFHLHEVAEEEERLPPLLQSLAVEGLPPLHHCVYLEEAEKVVMEYIKRWRIPSMESYFLLGLSLTGFMHWGVTSVDRLVAMAVLYGILFVVDDLFIDSPNDVLLGSYGIHVRGSPEEIEEYLDKVLNGNFAQKSLLAENPVEVIFSEVGRDMQRLSSPEWFSTFVEAVDEWFQASIASHADIVSGESSCVQDLESYSLMRAGNFGGTFVQLLQEFAVDVYLPREMRSLPFMVQARTDATMHLAFVNDIYSYHKESMVEANPRNVVTVLIESQEMTFVQSVRAAIELASMHAGNILDLEMKTSDATAQRHLQSLKDLMAGHLYYSNENKRYRHPDSVFPELRDVRASSSRRTTTNLACNPQAGVTPRVPGWPHSQSWVLDWERAASSGHLSNVA